MNTELEDLCPKCKCPIHPNLPCEEIIAFHNQVDEEYFDLLRLILEEGTWSPNRTGIDTLGVFGAQAKFAVDLDAFPILTTKKVWFKGIVHELLWFLRGDTNIKYLVDNDVHIWDEWAYKRHCDMCTQTKRGLPTQEEFIHHLKTNPKSDFGELGEGTYGSMWRKFPFHKARYSSWAKDKPHISWFEEDFQFGVDQLSKVIDKLKTNPDDRRMIVSAWHPYWVDHCALPPCHCLFHFNTEELTLQERVDKAAEILPILKFRPAFQGLDNKAWEEQCDKLEVPKRRLNLLLYQRSCDTFLGVPFNITSYSLLLAMVAHCVGMEPGTFTHTYGDLHIYENHLDQVKTQLTRNAKVLPKLWLNPNKKDLFDFTYEDIRLEGYDPHPAIKGDIAV